MKLSTTLTELQTFYQILDTYSEKYGYYSVAAILIKYHLAIYALDLVINGSAENNDEYRKELENAKNLLQDHYHKTCRTPRDQSPAEWSREITVDGNVAYVYDERRYELEYSKAGEEVACLVKPATQLIANDIESTKSYLYAVTQDRVPMVYLQPIPLTDLLYGQQRIQVKNGPVAHPVLLHNHRVTALGAGEVIFIKDQRGKIQGLILNNKSGHFRPAAQSMSVVVEAFQKSLAVDKGNILSIEVEIKEV